MSSLIFETRSFVVAWSSTRRLGCIVREPWALALSAYPRLESQMTVTMAGIAMIVIMAGITMIVTVSDFFFFTWVLRIRLRFSYLWGKFFTE